MHFTIINIQNKIRTLSMNLCPEFYRLVKAAGDVRARPGDADTAHVAAAVDQRQRARGAAHHLRHGHREQAQCPR